MYCANLGWQGLCINGKWQTFYYSRGAFPVLSCSMQAIAGHTLQPPQLKGLFAKPMAQFKALAHSNKMTAWMIGVPTGMTTKHINSGPINCKTMNGPS